MGWIDAEHDHVVQRPSVKARDRKAAAKKRLARLLALCEDPKVRSDAYWGRHVIRAQESSLRRLFGVDIGAALIVARRWLRSPKREIRAAAAFGVAYRGSERVLRDVGRIFSGTDTAAAERAALGAHCAGLHEIATPGFASGMRRLLAPTLTRAKRWPTRSRTNADAVYENAIRAILSLGGTIGQDFLLSQDCLRPGNAAVGRILWATLPESIGVHRQVRYRAPNPDLLWPIFDAALVGPPDKHRVLVSRLDVAILVLQHAAHRDPLRVSDESKRLLARQDLKSGHREYIHATLRQCRGIPSAKVLHDKFQRGRLRLRGTPANVLRALSFASNVVQDGLDLFLFNDGASAASVAEGLESIGLPRHAATVRRAMKLAGATALSSTSSVRTRMVNMSTPRRRALSRLSDRFLEEATAIEPAVQSFIVAHPELFRIRTAKKRARA